MFLKTYKIFLKVTNLKIYLMKSDKSYVPFIEQNKSLKKYIAIY